LKTKGQKSAPNEFMKTKKLFDFPDELLKVKEIDKKQRWIKSSG
jgi:hypothetical protein